MSGTNKRGQLAIYVIVAIVIVAAILVFFWMRGGLGDASGVPEDLAPVFDYYSSCIEQETRAAIQIAGTQGGRIYVEDYVPGNEYAPFSSQFNFLGFPVPYWYYVSSSGLIKENVPSKTQIERDIARYVGEGLSECDMESFARQGFYIETSEPEVKVHIEDYKVIVDVESDLSVNKNGVSARRTAHSVQVDSQLGKFYKSARKLYEKQKGDAVFEKYAVDVLRLYAPVDGVEIQCAPKIWATREVTGDIQDALEQNFAAIRFKGDYYESENTDMKYFVVDEEVDEAVNVMYSKKWPTKIEVIGDGVDEELMMAEPMGTQEGMGMMGFCYVPYHFVYDMSFPVLVQIYNTDEIFQFPVVVVVDNNLPRQAVFPNESILGEEEFDLCEYKNEVVKINLFDREMNPINGNLSFECFDQRCRLGETREGTFIGNAPACVNGFVSVRAGGYADKREMFSTNTESSVDIYLEREYDEELSVTVGGKEFEGNALVSFVREDGKAASAVYPQSKKITLSEGTYSVKVYVYGNYSLTLPESTKVQCSEVPKSGILGFFGGKEEKCFDIKMPETKLDYILIGGGMSSEYLLESELAKGKMKIDVQSLPRPNSLDQLQKNFESFETRRAYVTFYEK